MPMNLLSSLPALVTTGLLSLSACVLTLDTHTRRIIQHMLPSLSGFVHLANCF